MWMGWSLRSPPSNRHSGSDCSLRENSRIARPNGSGVEATLDATFEKLLCASVPLDTVVAAWSACIPMTTAATAATATSDATAG